MARPIADLQFMENNPLEHPPEQIDELKASLTSFGQVEPEIVNQWEGREWVIGGNGRLKAMLEMGWTHAAISYETLPPERAAELSVVLNASREKAKWIPEHLKRWLAAFKPSTDVRFQKMFSDLKNVVIPDPEPAKPASDSSSRLALLIECKDEESQESMCKELRSNGYRVQILGRGRGFRLA